MPQVGDKCGHFSSELLYSCGCTLCSLTFALCFHNIRLTNGFVWKKVLFHKCSFGCWDRWRCLYTLLVIQCYKNWRNRCTVAKATLVLVKCCVGLSSWRPTVYILPWRRYRVYVIPRTVKLFHGLFPLGFVFFMVCSLKNLLCSADVWPFYDHTTPKVCEGPSGEAEKRGEWSEKNVTNYG